MAFIPIPIYITKEDDETIAKQELLGKESHEMEIITVKLNTSLICYYYPSATGSVFVWMADSNVYETVMSIEAFETLLSAAESLIDMERVSEN